jgi:hypothetical protein
VLRFKCLKALWDLLTVRSARISVAVWNGAEQSLTLDSAGQNKQNALSLKFVSRFYSENIFPAYEMDYVIPNSFSDAEDRLRFRTRENCSQYCKCCA